MWKVRRGLVLACAALALAAAGCGSADDQGAATATISADDQRSAAIRRGGTLTVGSAVPISQLNPAVTTFAWERVLFTLLWSGLTRWDANAELAPDLATEWRSSEDQRSWTFELRDGVRFHDGTPLTAQMVADSFNYYLDERTVTQERIKIQDIEDVRAEGPLTVRFNLKRPNAIVPEAIADVKVIDVARLDSINKRPNGTGPFRLAGFVPDDRMTLERNADYFGEQPPLDAIRFVKAADSTAGATALRAGDLDVYADLPIGDAGQVAEDPSVRLVLNEPYSWAQTWKIDTSSPPFDDIKARQALSYATDRRAVLEKAYRGIGDVSITNNVVPEDSPAFARRGLVTYDYDLQKAKQLFEEAGVREGDTITWWGPAGIQPEKQLAGQILQASLAEIGIRVDIQNREVSAWTPKFIPPGQSFGGFIAPTGSAATPEPAYMLSAVRMGRCECNWDKPEYERAYEAALAEPDPQARLEKWGDLQRILSEEVPVVIPLLTTLVNGVRSDVSGVWSGSGGTQLRLEDAGFVE